MLTLFSIPKPFVERTAEIQLNALRSWVALGDDVQVVLLGNDAGVAEAARTVGVEHLPSLLCNEQGTPRLDSAFAEVDAVARHPLRCFVNADIVLLDDFLPAVHAAAHVGERFLVVGRTIDLDGVTSDEAADPPRLRARAAAAGVPRGAAALDYFVFPAGLFGELPPFLVGRAGFDNWLVWRARQVGPVIDASACVTAVHQSHDYAHLAGGMNEAYYGAEAAANIALVGGRDRIYTIHDASYKLDRDGNIRRNIGSILRVRETARKAAWKLGRR
ncbi:MAG: hypothetical protein EXQ81_10540 [Thermoleophilia bacterium]|nr:hypothetical protein [Thermoleophilia bacterium]